MDFNILCRGIEKGTGIWVEGDPTGNIYCTAEKGILLRNGKESIKIAMVFPETLEFCTGGMDVSGTPIYSGHIIKSTLNPHMAFVVGFGSHLAYCDLDDTWMNSFGFYAENMLGNFPLGDTAAWAQIIGDTFHNRQLAERVVTEEEWWDD